MDQIAEAVVQLIRNVAGLLTKPLTQDDYTLAGPGE